MNWKRHINAAKKEECQTQQVAASPRHMDGSIVFARLRQCAPPLKTCFLGPPESKFQTASRLVQLFFLYSSRHRVAILDNGPPFSPLKLPLPTGRSGPHLIHGSFGPPESSTQTASRSIQPFLHSSLQSVPFFAGHMHQTKYGDQMPSLRPASIIQGSAIGPASYVVNASDLHAVTDGNELCKYADDTRYYSCCQRWLTFYRAL